MSAPRDIPALTLSAARALAPGYPFRAPHYTAPTAAMAGELLLSAHGVLYLDQVEDFRAETLRRIAWYSLETLATLQIVTSPRPGADRESDGAAWDRARAILTAGA